MLPDTGRSEERLVIVVGADFTRSSQPALERARQIATATGAEVVLAHVVPEAAVAAVVASPGAATSIPVPTPTAAGAAALRSAADLAAERVALDLAGLDASAVVRVGRPPDELARVADEQSAWLLLVGVRGALGPNESLVLGTTAEIALRCGSTPVLVARGIAAAPYRRVLLPLEPGDMALLVLRTVALLAPEAIYDVVHFLPPAGRRGKPTSTHRDAVVASLTGLCAAAGLDPVRTQVLTFAADPREGIPAETKRRRPDLVAIGTRARSGLARVAFGSLADHVIHNAVGVDVLAVPPEARGRSRPHAAAQAGAPLTAAG
jgi:nucleotide-binding universal stress UspA family protein